MRKSLSQITQLIILTSGLSFTAWANATNIEQADSFYSEQNYQNAEKAYLELSQRGNAKAFYQLGQMYLEGHGVDENMLKAVLWFDLAAEQNYANAKQIVADLLKLASPQTKQNIEQIQQEFRKQQGWQTIKQHYFPILKDQALANKVYFGNGEQAQSAHQFASTEKYQIEINPNSDSHLRFKFNGPTAVLEPVQSEFLFGTVSSADFFKHNYSAIVDYDIEFDGSVRNLQLEQRIGYVHPKILSDLESFNATKPEFNQQAVSFVNRSFLGLAGESESFIRNHNEKIYAGLVRAARKLKKDFSIDGQFQYAMALTSFEWLAEDKNELARVLEKLAQAGHPLAQYELGLKLYREQQDIAQAIHWMSESAKAGIAKAEYRLGRILLNSPWVEKDESKALYWLESAAKESHVASILTASELKLLADNNKLHNLKTAQEYLAKIANSAQDNPQYEFLQAMVNFKQQPRQLDKAVLHIQKAIKLGDDLNWDVTEWQALLANWTSDGKVNVIDQPLAKL